MTDNTDLIARLHHAAKALQFDYPSTAKLLAAAADALAARDAACGHLPNELVGWLLSWVQGDDIDFGGNLTEDQIDALRAATFEVTE